MGGRGRGVEGRYQAWVDAERDFGFACFAFGGGGIGEEGDAAAVVGLVRVIRAWMVGETCHSAQSIIVR